METILETIAETLPVVTETIPATVPVTEPTLIIEVIESTTPDYITVLEEIAANTALSAEASTLLAGFMLFFVVVALCYFAYKFFRIFF